MTHWKFLVLLALPLTSALAGEPRLPVPRPVQGSLLERQEESPAESPTRFDFRLQNQGSVLGPSSGSRIHKLRDQENRSTCYVLTLDHADPKQPPQPGSIACVKD